MNRDGTQSVFQICRAIDIDNILSLRFRHNNLGRPVTDLKGDPQEWEKSQSPLCQIFVTMRPRPSREGSGEDLALCTFHQDNRLRLLDLWDKDLLLLAAVREDDKRGGNAGKQVSNSTQETVFPRNSSP